MDTRTVYTIFAEFGGAWAWIKRDGVWLDSTQLGGCCAWSIDWGGDYPLSVDLGRDSASWQGRFEIWVDPVEDSSDFDWEAFHAEGFGVAKRMKAEIVAAARVLYRKTSWDPAARRIQAWEILESGEVAERPLQLLPSWACRTRVVG
jgi:hypothetical protein